MENLSKQELWNVMSNDIIKHCENCEFGEINGNCRLRVDAIDAGTFGFGVGESIDPCGEIQELSGWKWNGIILDDDFDYG